jgi:AbrB family looped-hinge helix DNA binding protein
MTTTLSSKYQITIPKKVRMASKIKPGTKFNVLFFDGRIELLPIEKPEDLRGIAPNIQSQTVIREDDRL